MTAVGIIAVVGLAVLARGSGVDDVGSPAGDVGTIRSASTTSNGSGTRARGVAIVDFEFAPHTITVDVGSRVTWSNTDHFAHRLVAADVAGTESTGVGSFGVGSFGVGSLGVGSLGVGSLGVGSLGSEDLEFGDSFQHVFATVGRFPYYCEIHPSMTGLVIVEAAR